MSLRGILFLLLTFIFILFSRRSLLKPQTHGFYRFFVFEGILLLVLLNHPFWFRDPFSPLHLLSWLLLMCSILYVVLGLQGLRVYGGSQKREDFPANHQFENTTTLVECGIYRYVRHPMYGSLLLLAWGACFKQVTVISVALSCFVSVLLIITAKVEERENIRFFGADYLGYCHRTKMFIPFLI